MCSRRYIAWKCSRCYRLSMAPRRKRVVPDRSAERGARRSALIDELASFVLRKGLSDTSLRHLAAQHGTSDRMLLYYFRTKEELLVAVLDRISERLARILQGSS